MEFTMIVEMGKISLLTKGFEPEAANIDSTFPEVKPEPTYTFIE